MQQAIKYFQEKVVFLPKKLPINYSFHFDKTFTELFLQTPNDGLINALLFTVEKPKGIILYFHGNADNLIRWGKIASKFTEYQYDVFVMDYRSYGKSIGERTEENLYTDAQFCYNYIKEKYSENNIIIIGRSLGGVFATRIASTNNPKMLLLEGVFYNLEDMAKRWLNTNITSKFSPHMIYHLLSNEFIPKVSSPIFHFHGTNDFVVPIISGKKLFKEISHLNKKFIEIQGGSHNDLIKFNLYNAEMNSIFL